MRLFNVLRGAITRAGGRIILGPGVTGWVEKGRPVGVIAETAGGPRKHSARRLILATGGFRHGGLNAPARGQARESVFGLPVVTGAQWFAPLYWGAHPYARFGVRVNAAGMQPVDADGNVIYPGVFAIGGLLAGADRNGEGSREGIDLATAWKVVNGLSG
jgi:glycerol-3-phosphate dehydrogenase subunit B